MCVLVFGHIHCLVCKCCRMVMRMSSVLLLCGYLGRCHQLTHLKLNYCSQVSEGGIETLGTIRSLVSVDISGSSCGDQAVSALGSNTNLRDVCLSECPNVTDLGLQKFTQQCQLIHSFDISHCLVSQLHPPLSSFLSVSAPSGMMGGVGGGSVPVCLSVVHAHPAKLAFE